MRPPRFSLPSLTASLAKKELVPIFSGKWDRIIPCHGDVIDSGGRAAWDKVWGKYKTDVVAP